MKQYNPRQPMHVPDKPVREPFRVKYGRSATTPQPDLQTPIPQTPAPTTSMQPTPTLPTSMPPTHNVALQAVSGIPAAAPLPAAAASSETASVSSETEVARTASRLDVPASHAGPESHAGPAQALSVSSGDRPAASHPMTAHADPPRSLAAQPNLAVRRSIALPAERGIALPAEHTRIASAAERGMSTHYELWTCPAGILGQPGLFYSSLAGPNLAAHPPVIDGPVVALVGQFQLSRDPRFARVLSVSFAANFGQRDPGNPYTVGVLFPRSSAPLQPSLAHLIAWVLGEAALSPKRFLASGRGANSLDERTTHSHDELSVLLHLRDPNGVPLRELFSPCLTRQPLPRRTKLRIPDMLHGAAGNRSTYLVTLTLYDALKYRQTGNLAETQMLLSNHNPAPGHRDIIGGSGLIADLEAGPAALLARDPERYIQAASQMARLVICGYPSFGFLPLV